MDARQERLIRERDAQFDEIPDHWVAQADRRALLQEIDRINRVPSPQSGIAPQSEEEWTLRAALAKQADRFERSPGVLPCADMILSAITQTGWKLVRADEEE